MAMSETLICNIALGLIGEPNISSLDEQTKAGRLCSSLYPVQRDIVLADHVEKYASMTDEELFQECNTALKNKDTRSKIIRSFLHGSFYINRALSTKSRYMLLNIYDILHNVPSFDEDVQKIINSQPAEWELDLKIIKQNLFMMYQAHIDGMKLDQDKKKDQEMKDQMFDKLIKEDYKADYKKDIQDNKNKVYVSMEKKI